MNKKIYKKFLKLMDIRGFNIAGKEDFKSRFKNEEYFEIFEKDDIRVGVMYIESDKNKEYIGAGSLRIFIDRLLREDLKRGILISFKPLASKTKPIVNNFLDYIHLEFMTSSSIRNSPLDHYFCKVIEKVVDVEALKVRLNIKNPKKELMLLCADDPVCQRFGYIEPDVVSMRDKDTNEELFMCVSKN